MPLPPPALQGYSPRGSPSGPELPASKVSLPQRPPPHCSSAPIPHPAWPLWAAPGPLPRTPTPHMALPGPPALWESPRPSGLMTSQRPSLSSGCAVWSSCSLVVPQAPARRAAGPRPWLSAPCGETCTGPRPEPRSWSPSASPASGAPSSQPPAGDSGRPAGFFPRLQGLLRPAVTVQSARGWVGIPAAMGAGPPRGTGVPKLFCPHLHTAPWLCPRACSAAPRCWLTSAHELLHRWPSLRRGHVPTSQMGRQGWTRVQVS